MCILSCLKNIRKYSTPFEPSIESTNQLNMHILIIGGSGRTGKLAIAELLRQSKFLV